MNDEMIQNIYEDAKEAGEILEHLKGLENVETDEPFAYNELTPMMQELGQQQVNILSYLRDLAEEFKAYLEDDDEDDDEDEVVSAIPPDHVVLHKDMVKQISDYLQYLGVSFLSEIEVDLRTIQRKIKVKRSNALFAEIFRLVNEKMNSGEIAIGFHCVLAGELEGKDPVQYSRELKAQIERNEAETQTPLAGVGPGGKPVVRDVTQAGRKLKKNIVPPKPPANPQPEVDQAIADKQTPPANPYQAPANANEG